MTTAAYTPPADHAAILNNPDRLADPAATFAAQAAAADAAFQTVLAHYAPRAGAVADALVGIAQARLASESRGHTAKADAIAAYERTAELAVSMGEGSRVCKRALTSFSAAEISNMNYTLGVALDGVAARKAAGK